LSSPASLLRSTSCGPPSNLLSSVFLVFIVSSFHTRHHAVYFCYTTLFTYTQLLSMLTVCMSFGGKRSGNWADIRGRAYRRTGGRTDTIKLTTAFFQFWERALKCLTFRKHVLRKWITL
jgi:hypothetical protein